MLQLKVLGLAIVVIIILSSSCSIHGAQFSKKEKISMRQDVKEINDTVVLLGNDFKIIYKDKYSLSIEILDKTKVKK